MSVVRALIVGGTGQLGARLTRTAPAGWDVVAPSRAELDLTDSASVRTGISRAEPDVIINAAGFTDVDGAERDPDTAFAVNTLGAVHLAEASARSGARLIVISTDYVFDGQARTPYRPDAPTNPLNAYGRTKAEGERETLTRAPGTLVIRTAWLYGPTGRNFVRTMIARMTAGAPLRVVNDQTGAPTSTATLAAAVWRAAALPGATGIHHVTDAGATSWYDFASAIAADGSAMGLVPSNVAITPVTSAEFGAPARRPAYGVLDTSATAAALDLEFPPWRDALQPVLAELRA
jgi:dTDP-4-dehydrorhamnose reductase